MKLNILSKIAAVFIALTIPIIVLLYLIAVEKNKSIDFGAKEILGDLYMAPSRNLMNDIHKLKLQVYRQKSGMPSFDSVSSLEGKIEKSLIDIDSINKKYPQDFPKTEKTFLDLRKAWTDLKSKSGSLNASNSDDEHSKVISSLKDFVKEVGDESNLILDPDLDTYYIMDTTLLKFIAITDSLHLLQAELEKIAHKKDVTNDDTTQIIILTNDLNNNLDGVKVDFATAYQNSANKKLKASIDSFITASQTSIKGLVDFALKASKQEKVNFSVKQVQSMANKAADLTATAWDLSVKENDALLKIRVNDFISSKNNTILYSSLAAIILLLFGGYLVLGIVRGIRTLDNTAKMVSKGELEISADVKTGDELESLAGSFNVMISSLKAYIGQADTARESSEKVAKELEGLIKDTTKSVTQVKQSSEIVADNARIVAEAATLAVEVSTEGETAVNQSIEGVEKIKHQIESVAEKILQLSSQTQLIGEIISTVEDITQQSKFLAFNASIEASKAGEYGKGFAIVANEIRNLSEESKEATKKISDILNQIQQLTNESVMMTEDGTKLADAGVELSKNAGGSIQKLVYSIQNSSEAAYQISSSVIEQRTNLEDLEKNMKSIQFT